MYMESMYMDPHSISMFCIYTMLYKRHRQVPTYHSVEVNDVDVIHASLFYISPSK